MNSLLQWGFGPDFLRQLDPSEFTNSGPCVGRIVTLSHGLLLLACGDERRAATPSGQLREDPPLVGDWVVYRPEAHDGPVLVTRVLERRSHLERRDPGQGRQGLAANVDVVLATLSLDQPPNLRRLERTLAAIGQSGAEPVILLTKTDLCPRLSEALDAVRGVADGAAVVSVNALGDPEAARAALGPWLREGQTLTLLGPSGVGKSTLVNALLGDPRQDTGEVRHNDGKGRHTTTERRLFLVPGGGLILDSPGLRELGLVDDESGLDAAFSDVLALFAGCRWRDCAHEGEPGCDVEAALADGRLQPERWASYRKLQREVRHEQTLSDKALAREEKSRWKRIHEQARARAIVRDRQRW